MSCRTITLRRLLASGNPRLPTGLAQRRWAQVHDTRFLTTHQPDKILEKYKQKLAEKAKQEGVEDIGQLKEKYKAKIEDLRQKATTPGLDELTQAQEQASPSTSPSAQSQVPYNAPPTPPPSPQSPTAAAAAAASGKKGVKTLSSYLDVDKILALPAKEIEALWRLRHVQNPQSLCATIPLDVYSTIEATAKKHPFFILPLPREGQGAEIHFLQWTFPAPNTVTVLFTHLAEYKLRGEFSQPHTTITHHLELAESKDVVLLQGQVMEGRGVSVDEAKWLVMCLQKFYGVGGENGQRKKLLEMFGKGDPAFTVEDLVDEAEKII